MNYTPKFKAVMVLVYITLLLSFIGLPIAFIALGSDATIQHNPLYPYRSSIFIQDDFLFGIATSGSIGQLGWSSAGGISAIGGGTNNIGVYRLDTSAVSATQARISPPISGTTPVALPHSMLFVSKLNTNDANTTVRMGISVSVSANPPTDGIYIEKLDADTNWFCVTRAASVQTRTDSGVAINTSFNTFSYTRNSSGVQFYINNVPACGLISTNVPGAGLFSPVIFIINSAAAAKNIDVDYFQLIISGINR